MIAKLKPREDSRMLKGRTHQIQVIGIGHQKSQGVKSGVVIDLNRAEQAIRLAVDAAERMAGLTVESLFVNLGAGRLLVRLLSRNPPGGGPAEIEAPLSLEGRMLAVARMPLGQLPAWRWAPR